MNKILSNIFKGLVVVLVLVVIVGVVSINMKMAPSTSMVLEAKALSTPSHFILSIRQQHPH